jgi:hypothetical protein
MDSHLMNSALLNFGVTPGGAFQFMQGLPIATQEDRDALRAKFLGANDGAEFRLSPPQFRNQETVGLSKPSFLQKCRARGKVIKLSRRQAPFPQNSFKDFLQQSGYHRRLAV